MDDAIAKTMRMGDLRKQRGIWLGNIRENLPVIFRNKDVRPLAGLFSNVPGIVVGAGPSLAKNIHTLAAHAKDYPLFCTDRAFRKLHAAGVIPQFTVVVDWQDAVADFFAGMPVEKTTLIVSIKASPKVLQLPWRRMIFFLVQDFDKKFEQAERNLTEDRVAGIPGAIICGNSSYLLARLAGCNPVTFVGCDMSSPEPSSDPGDMNYEAVDMNGNKIYSLPGYLAGLEWLLTRLRVDKEVASGKVKVYNSTEGGIMYADIIPPLALEEFVARHPGAKSSLNTRILKNL